MIGRVTAQLTANIARENLQANLARLNALTEMASSQRRISRPSVDPIGAGQAMRARSDLRAAEQHVRNADNGIGWLRQRCCLQVVLDEGDWPLQHPLGAPVTAA